MASNHFDLLVIGGGSGGLACSKEAAKLGAKVAVCDFVKPSPQGSSWGLGGTCVNVGCIPKKLMHQASLLGEGIKDAIDYGWAVPQEEDHKPAVAHKWETLVEAVQNHIGSLNWGYRVALKDNNVHYLNSYATFLDPHTVRTVNKKGVETIVTADTIILATGGRPKYPDIIGAKEIAITSDDLFSLPQAPGKTLVVGASYVALECAGFLAGLGYETTVMVRSILLRGFDQQIAEKIGQNLEAHGVKLVRGCVPTRLEKRDDGKINVFYGGDVEGQEVFDTVLVATGRDVCTSGIGLETVGVALDPKTGKVVVNERDQTNVPHIYAIGDMALGRPELTPVAIQAGVLLAKRLYAGGTKLCDYVNVPTTVFTPLEYGCCGLSEEDAIAKYKNVEVYHTSFTPLEFTVAHKFDNACYAKIICDKDDDERVLGIHILAPNAGEVVQGFAIAFKLGAKKEHFDELIGIHPTNAENFTTLNITKASGKDVSQKGC